MNEPIGESTLMPFKDWSAAHSVLVCYTRRKHGWTARIYLFIYSFVRSFVYSAGQEQSSMNVLCQTALHLFPPLVKVFRKQTFPYFVISISTIYFRLHIPRHARTHARVHAHTQLHGTHLKIKFILWKEYRWLLMVDGLFFLQPLVDIEFRRRKAIQRWGDRTLGSAFML